MKRKLLTFGLALTTVASLAACGSDAVTTSTSSLAIEEAQQDRADKAGEDTVDKSKEEAKKDAEKKAAELKKAAEEKKSEEKKAEETKKEEETKETEQKKKDPYAGLAVSNCHDVMLPLGVDYNAAMDEVVRGTTHYPNTYPSLDNVDFNTPGTYECAWVRETNPGVFTTLDYAKFKVIITDSTSQNGLITADQFEWSLSSHSTDIVTEGSQYVYYYGTGSISGTPTSAINAPGNYIIKWTSTDGGSFDQHVRVVE